MSWEEILKFLSVVLLSSVKFSLGGVPLALGYQLSFFTAVLATSIGGILGVVIFTYLSEFLIRTGKKIKKNRNEVKPKRKFTLTNKFIIRTKRILGLWGISLLTPLLLSIPLGVFVAVKYFKNRNLIMLYMTLFVVFWSMVLCSIQFLF